MIMIMSIVKQIPQLVMTP